MKSLFNLFKGGSKDQPYITVVSGLPRSGTSMMMQILEAGGIPVLTDGEREADISNPKGYYEFERVKQLDRGDTGWVANAPGTVVKVISALLRHLPDGYQYRVIFMRRPLEEVLRSQKTMLTKMGRDTDAVADTVLQEKYQSHLDTIIKWLASKPNFSVCYVDYTELVQNPQQSVQAINRFLGGNLNVEAMQSVVDPSLYRQRTAQQD